MRKIIKKALLILLAMFVLVGIWSFFFSSSANTPKEEFYVFSFMSLSLPIVYSLLYQKKYPIQTILVFSIVEFFLYLLTFFQTDTFQLQLFFVNVNLFWGSFITLIGGFVDKVAIKLLSPMQIYYYDKRLKLSTPVLSGIICFIIGYFLITTELYKFVTLS